MNKRLLAVLMAMILVCLCACANPAPAATQTPDATQTSAATQTPDATAAASQEPEQTAEQEPEQTAAAVSEEKTLTDRNGDTLTVPSEMTRIVSLAPAATEILFGLGQGSVIVGADTYAADIEGIDAAICVFDAYAVDSESILALEPDLVITSGMSTTGAADDPMAALRTAGVAVSYLPTSESIEAIYEDIRFLAELTGAQEEGEAMIKQMQETIAQYQAIGETITEKKTVLFEISASPYIYSFGSGTFLDELLTVIGAENAVTEIEGWTSLSDEAAVALNPDVILTNVNYTPDPVGEILALPAFASVQAVQDQAVYAIDANASSRPTQNILKALEQMAVAVYPEYYAE